MHIKPIDVNALALAWRKVMATSLKHTYSAYESGYSDDALTYIYTYYQQSWLMEMKRAKNDEYWRMFATHLHVNTILQQHLIQMIAMHNAMQCDAMFFALRMLIYS